MSTLSILLDESSDSVTLKKSNRKIFLSPDEVVQLSKVLKNVERDIRAKKMNYRLQGSAGLMFATYIRKQRIAANLSQGDVARHFEYESAQFISNWERGLSKPPVELLKTLAKILSISSKDLFELYLKAEIEMQKRKLTHGFQSS